jgi:excisionase family DNA binding protein
MSHESAGDDKTRLISLPEAAELYGLSPSYLRALAQKGRLKAQKVGDRWVTCPQDVEQYIRSRQQRGVFRDDIQLD